MLEESGLAMVREMLLITIKIAVPILAAGVAIGLLISILQAVTSIQDQTIVFVPKILVMLIVSAIILPWVAARLIEYATEMLTLT